LHFFGKGIETHIGSENNSGDLTGIRRFMRDKTKILVVDDQMAVAMMMVFVLARAGCEARAALDAEKAMRLANTEAFDLITLDVGMPDLDGFRLFQKLRQIPHLKETPIVFVSGNSTIENQQQALELGAVDFIEKPFGTKDFLARILSHINPTLAHA
jgi:DNA-binding response OmpR family regulator